MVNWERVMMTNRQFSDLVQSYIASGMDEMFAFSLALEDELCQDGERLEAMLIDLADTEVM